MKKHKRVQIAWVAAKMRVVVFIERDRIWNRRTKKPTNRFGKPYWVAGDVRSYHLGVGKTVPQAVNALILQVQSTNLIAEEAKANGEKVIRWRCLLKPKEVKEWETKAKKTGFILDGVITPPLPIRWQRQLERFRNRKSSEKS